MQNSCLVSTCKQKPFLKPFWKEIIFCKTSLTKWRKTNLAITQVICIFFDVVWLLPLHFSKSRTSSINWQQWLPWVFRTSVMKSLFFKQTNFSGMRDWHSKLVSFSVRGFQLSLNFRTLHRDFITERVLYWEPQCSLILS